MGHWAKKITICIIQAMALFFLFSCASVQQQQIGSRDTISSNHQGFAYMKSGAGGRTSSDGKAPAMNSLLAVAYNNRGMISVEEGK
jgi:hypothetical protein